MSLNKKKYHNAILYFVQNCNNNKLGATKLNKLVYYLDFVNYRDNNKSVTGDEYINKQYGPVPLKMDDVLYDLKEQKHLEIIEDPFFSADGKERNKVAYKSEAKIDMSVFNENEVNLLAKVCDTFKDYTTNKIVAQTHLEGPWFYSKPYDKISYDYANTIDII